MESGLKMSVVVIRNVKEIMSRLLFLDPFNTRNSTSPPIPTPYPDPPIPILCPPICLQSSLH